MVKPENSPPIGHGQLAGVEQDQPGGSPPGVEPEQSHGPLPGVEQDQPGGSPPGLEQEQSHGVPPGEEQNQSTAPCGEHETSDVLNGSVQPYSSDDYPLDPHYHPNHQQDATDHIAPSEQVPNNPALIAPPNNLLQYSYNERQREAIRQLLETPEVAADIPVREREKESTALVKKLMAHQRIGLTWLMKQEQGPNKGGILADDMGLGKTIQAIALILARPPNDGARKTTLIVVPTSLIYQWEQEINDKVKPSHKLKIHIFHGHRKSRMTVAKLLSHDIVLTTYGTIAHEWKNVYEKRKSEAAILLASHAIFHRIILDEAHNIKNRHALASRGADRLHGTYRLCMTGTPLMNSFDELYPLLRFLRIEPYREWSSWSSLIGNRHDDGANIRRLQVLLSRVLLRRTEKTMIDGQPILTLPALTVHTIHAVFDDDQRAYYDALQKRSTMQVNKYLKEGTLTRFYWAVLVLLLRLRQCCCHPHLIRDHDIPEGVHITTGDMTKLARKLSKRAVDQIKLQRDFECPMCNERIDNPVLIYPCGHHICGNCVTNMMATLSTVNAPLVDAERDMPQLNLSCPTVGCDEFIDAKNFICYKWFADVHLPDKTGDMDLDDSDDSDEEDAYDEDSDEEGSLADFIVSDGDETSVEDEDEELDNGLTSESSPQPQLDTPQPASEDPDDNMCSDGEYSHHLKLGAPQPELEGSDESPRSEANPEGVSELSSPATAAEGNTSDSDDSLPPIDLLVAQIKKKAEISKAKRTPLPRLSGVKHKRENVTGSPHSNLVIRNGTKLNNNSKAGNGVSPGQKKRPAEKGLARPKKKAKKEKKAKSKGRATELTLGALKKSNLSSAAARERYFKGLRKNWETSAKIEKAMELLSMIRRDFPDEKTLVFSQFTSFLDLMEIPISDDGYNYRRYDGSMSDNNRDAAVNDFMKKPDVKIMLLSLKCGNAGLNLYAATRVIMLDPFWNPYVEDQAIKRAHRLGQTNPVIAYRILVKETVEDNVLKLQEIKRARVHDALNPEARNGVSRLSTMELAGLFGITSPK